MDKKSKKKGKIKFTTINKNMMERKLVNQDQKPKKDIDPDVKKYVERQKKENEWDKLINAQEKAEQKKYQSNYGKKYF